MMGQGRLWSLLASAALAQSAYAQAADPVDTVLVAGKIVTVDDKDSIASALAIRGDRIVAVGSDAEIRALAGPDTKVIELGGRTAIPGLIDSHIHAVRDGRLYNALVDLSEARSVKDVLASLRAAADRKPANEWVVVFGNWHKNQLAERRAPTPAELQAAVPDHPVLLLHQYDFMILNKPALAALDITSATSLPAPLKAEIGRDGKPTGFIGTVGGAIALNALLPRVTPEQSFETEVASSRAYLRALVRVGLTGITDDGGYTGSEFLRPVYALWQRDQLPLRIRINVAANNLPGRDVEPGGELRLLKNMLQLIPPRLGDKWLRVEGVGELLTVGMIDASILSDYVPRTAEAKRHAVETAAWLARNGYSLDVHSSHDANTSVYLDVFEEVNRTTPIGPLRWKISHCEDCTVDTIRRMKALGMGLNVQDRMYFDGDDYVKKWGSDVAARAPAVVSATRLGVPVGGGSDASAVSPRNPFIGLRWLIDGRSVIGTPTRDKAELMSRMEALRAYTINNSWMSFEEKERGSLEKGKLADLVILDRDYLTIPVKDIGEIKPLMTMVGGRVEYSSPAFADSPGKK